MKREIDTERRMDGCKALFHLDRVFKHFDDGERISPVHIDMGISKGCQIGCKFCFRYFQDPSREYIQRGALLQTMRDAGEIGVRSIGIIGDGDGTTNPFLYEALREGKNAGVDMALSTNGVDVDTEDKMKTILETCTWMRWCISAGTREGYKKIHSKDYFDKVVLQIRQMIELKDKIGSDCDLGLQAVFVPGLMKGEMLAEAKLAVDLKIPYFVIKQTSLPDEGESGMVQFDLEDYNSQEVIDELQACEDLSNDITKIIPKWNTMNSKGVREYDGCMAPPLLAEMSGNGDFFACGWFFGDKPEYDYLKYGNVHDQTLKEIVESDRYWEIVRILREDFDVHTQCKGCCRLGGVNKWLYDYERAKKCYDGMEVPHRYLKRSLEGAVKDMPVPKGRNFI